MNQPEIKYGVKEMEKQIVKFDESSKHALDLKIKYENLIVTPETLKESKIALSNLKQARYMIQNVVKENHEILKGWTKANKDRGNEKIAIIKPIEERIQAEINEIEAEKRRKKEEEKQRELERIEGIKKRMHEYIFPIESKIKEATDPDELNDLEIEFPDDEEFSEFKDEMWDGILKMKEMKRQKIKELKEKIEVEAMKKRLAELEAKEKERSSEKDLEEVGIDSGDPVEKKDPLMEITEEITDERLDPISALEKAEEESEEHPYILDEKDHDEFLKFYDQLNGIEYPIFTNVKISEELKKKIDDLSDFINGIHEINFGGK